jgi:hypothetical protein
MKKFLCVAGSVLALSMSSFAFAGEAENAAWINKCFNEVDREGNSESIVKSWCTCMNGEMDESETLSILAWVKTANGKKADDKCTKSSGWVEKK